MTLADIEETLDAIRRVCETDNEDAHGIEDDLYTDVLKYIGETDQGQLGALARAALKAKTIAYTRWYA